MTPLMPLVLLLVSFADEPAPAAPRAPDRELPGGVAVELLTAEEARTAIVDPTDPFFAKLTLLEISLRMDRDVTELPHDEALVQFRAFLREQVTDWPEDERDTLLAALPMVAEACRAGCPEVLPERWRFIRTTGKDESSSPYTRGDCIVLPAGMVSELAGQNVEMLGKIIVHETFHVYSRLHPEARDALYAEIGFRPIPPVALPESVERIRLTNPDGPGWEHAITVRDKETGEECRAVLLTTSRVPGFLKATGGVVPVLQFHLYPLTKDDPPALRLDDAGQPVRWLPFMAPGFYEAIGKNTGYIIHPDEILAENVVLLAYPREEPKSPELIERLRARFADPEPAPKPAVDAGEPAGVTGG